MSVLVALIAFEGEEPLGGAVLATDDPRLATSDYTPVAVYDLATRTLRVTFQPVLPAAGLLLTTEDGRVLCRESGSPIIWPDDLTNGA